MNSILSDIRIIAVEQGPFGSMHLADLGADVIKIEDPNFGGDVGRYVPPFPEGEHSLFFETFSRNQQSLSLDISTTAGRVVFEDLVAKADAVYSNLRRLTAGTSGRRIPRPRSRGRACRIARRSSRPAAGTAHSRVRAAWGSRPV